MVHLIAIADYMQTHVVSIVLAIVVSYAVGFLWHGPLFGKQWMEANKIPMPKKEDMKFSMMLPGLSANFVAVLVQASVMGRAFQILEMPSIWHAFIITTIFWLPFTGLTILNSNAWLGKSIKVTLLDALYYLVSYWSIAAVLYVTL